MLRQPLTCTSVFKAPVHTIKRVTEKLVLIFMGIALPIVILIGGEVLLRTFPALLPAPIRTSSKAPLLDLFRSDPERLADPELISRFRPGVVITTANEIGDMVEFRTVSLGFQDVGFRDDGLNEEKGFRAVVLGDSFAEGAWVNLDDGWVELLEQRSGADFVNLGVGTYGTIQERIVLERYGLELEPDLVVLAFFSGNDFGNDGCYEGEVNQRVDERLKGFLSRYFYSYEMLKYILGQSRVNNPYVPELNESSGGGLAYRSEGLELVFHIEHLNSMERDDPPPWIARGAELTPDNILRIQEICNENGIEFIVVICPSKEQVYWDIMKTLLAESERYDPDWPNSLIESSGVENGIHVLDLTPVFRAHSGDQLYFTEDTHWNVEGNRLAAEAVYTYLAENGLLPVSP